MYSEKEIRESLETLESQLFHKLASLSSRSKWKVEQQKVVVTVATTKREKQSPWDPFSVKDMRVLSSESQITTTTIASNNKLNITLYTYKECKYIGMAVHSKADQQASKCRHTRQKHAMPGLLTTLKTRATPQLQRGHRAGTIECKCIGMTVHSKAHQQASK